MNIPEEDHVVRHAPYSKLIRDKDDNTIGVLPQAFELRLEAGESYLSVNWLEYFSDGKSSRIEALVKDFRAVRKKSGARVGTNSAFCIGNVDDTLSTCTSCGFNKVRIVYEKPSRSNPNKSHSKIIRLPPNDDDLLSLFASSIFNNLVMNTDIPST